jgi:hypothetical protein
VSHKREEEEVGKDDQMATIEALPLLLLIVNSKAYLFSRVTMSRIRRGMLLNMFLKRLFQRTFSSALQIC